MATSSLEQDFILENQEQLNVLLELEKNSHSRPSVDINEANLEFTKMSENGLSLFKKHEKQFSK